MNKTNKELAVELYVSLIKANATIWASPNYKGESFVPSFDVAVKEINELKEKLETIND